MDKHRPSPSTPQITFLPSAIIVCTGFGGASGYHTESGSEWGDLRGVDVDGMRVSGFSSWDHLRAVYQDADWAGRGGHRVAGSYWFDPRMEVSQSIEEG